MPEPQYPPKPRPGDRVAVLSPSGGLPQIFPLPFELGLRRLRDDFGLEPVEYPTTRRLDASPSERAADVHAAFADPSIRAVIASIGGDDQITVLPHLDAEVLRADPKPFFGFSDNVNLLAYLFGLGIVGYHGGAVMTDFGRAGAMHPLSAASLRAALFDTGDFALSAPPTCTDVDVDWADAGALASEPPSRPAEGWTWVNPDVSVAGRAWGGCLEVVSWLLMADVAVPAAADLDGAILFFETSEELPTHDTVYRVLRGLGERGVLGRCGGLLMGRAKGWSFEHRNDDATRRQYLDAQRAAVSRAMTEYAPRAPIVFDVDFGHTDPRLVIPYGGQVRIDGPTGAVTVRY